MVFILTQPNYTTDADALSTWRVSSALPTIPPSATIPTAINPRSLASIWSIVPGVLLVREVIQTTSWTQWCLIWKKWSPHKVSWKEVLSPWRRVRKGNSRAWGMLSSTYGHYVIGANFMVVQTSIVLMCFLSSLVMHIILVKSSNDSQCRWISDLVFFKAMTPLGCLGRIKQHFPLTWGSLLSSDVIRQRHHEFMQQVIGRLEHKLEYMAMPQIQGTFCRGWPETYELLHISISSFSWWRGPTYRVYQRLLYSWNCKPGEEEKESLKSRPLCWSDGWASGLLSSVPYSIRVPLSFWITITNPE